MQLWEYREDINLLESEMNTLGKKGWELVGYSVLDSSRSRHFVFKRALAPAPAEQQQGAKEGNK